MSEKPKIYVYVGADKCGCVVAIHSVNDPYVKDDPTQWRKGLAECFTEWAMAGYTIHFVAKDEGCRLMNLDCDHLDTPNEPDAIKDAYEEYLDGLRFSNERVLDLQAKLEFVSEKLREQTWEELNPEWIEEGDLTHYFAKSQFDNCPGCGKFEHLEVMNTSHDDEGAMVMCRPCGFAAFGDTPTKAINRWNTRAALSEAPSPWVEIKSEADLPQVEGMFLFKEKRLPASEAELYWYAPTYSDKYKTMLLAKYGAVYGPIPEYKEPK